MINFVINAIFVAFVIFLVVGFNRQMSEKNAKKDEIMRKFKDKK